MINIQAKFSYLNPRAFQKITGGSKNSRWIKIIFFAFEFRSAIYQKSTLEIQNKHCDESNTVKECESGREAQHRIKVE